MVAVPPGSKTRLGSFKRLPTHASLGVGSLVGFQISRPEAADVNHSDSSASFAGCRSIPPGTRDGSTLPCQIKGGRFGVYRLFLKGLAEK